MTTSRSVDDVTQAFHTAVPGMRMRFYRKVTDLGRTLGHDYERLHPLKVLNAAQDELRLRVEVAAKLVEELIDSGWQPSSSTTAPQVFESLLAYADKGKDLYSDLNGAIKKAFVDVRRDDAEQETAYVELLNRAREHLIDDVHGRFYSYVAKDPR